MVVKITQEQADYLKTFGEEKKTAIYYIARWGWGIFLKDGNGKIYEDDEEKPFKQDESENMINALINGYEVAVPKYKFYNFSNKTGTIPLYYAGKDFELMSDVRHALKVENGSKEYIALETLGFFKKIV